ncbi:hypothetical protein KC799_15770 [candidate division KSB1 bacterium]|nr:hypothetical protein [candidate division KSB1 bacterium]
MIDCMYNCGFYNEKLGILICRPKDELTAEKMNDIAICRECLQKSGLPQVNRFHDLTAITSINLKFEDVHRISRAEATIRKGSRDVVACYLVSNNLLYGTVRMYEALIETSGVHVYVSYNLSELAEKLGVDEKELVEN